MLSPLPIPISRNRGAWRPKHRAFFGDASHGGRTKALRAAEKAAAAASETPGVILPFPGGVAVNSKGEVYITLFSIFPGMGMVARVM